MNNRTRRILELSKNYKLDNDSDLDPYSSDCMENPNFVLDNVSENSSSSEAKSMSENEPTLFQRIDSREEGNINQISLKLKACRKMNLHYSKELTREKRVI
ncbi:hypothetical protein QE152_g4358 [Popillia japonica]|uniref:Uncharacterized protein n=1 Tax=Popillia japonica TaxID=7064 RepID=A0AAW1MZ07_POPJA